MAYFSNRRTYFIVYTVLRIDPIAMAVAFGG